MAATTEDRKNVLAGTEIEAYPVKGSENIPLHVAVCINASGYAVNGSDTAGLTFVGVSRERADNSGSATDGAIKVTVRREGAFAFKFSGTATIADVGKVVCVVDNQTVALATTTTNDIACGKISQFIDASNVRVDIAR